MEEEDKRKEGSNKTMRKKGRVQMRRIREREGQKEEEDVRRRWRMVREREARRRIRQFGFVGG